MNKKAILISLIGIFLLVQSIGAQTWIATKRLTFNPGDSGGPVCDVDSNDNIHAVWYDDSPGNHEIYYKKSTNGGSTWTTKRLTYNSGNSWAVDLAVDTGNNLYIVWFDDTPGNFEIYLKKSTNGGSTWTTKRLTYTSGDSVTPIIAVDSNNHIHVVWTGGVSGGPEIFYKKSTDGGTTWTTKRLTRMSGFSYLPTIAVDSNSNTNVVWRNDTPGNFEIYFIRSTNGGTTWTKKRLTYTAANSSFPVISVDSNDHIHVAWQEEAPGNPEIYYKKSTNGGANWTTKRLSWNFSDSEHPAIAVDSNDYVHVVCQDAPSGNSEIFYRRSTDGGTTWKAKRLTYNFGQSKWPTLSTDSANSIHVVWEDDSPGNSEIFYRKGSQ
jgi:hypothetical protein